MSFAVAAVLGAISIASGQRIPVIEYRDVPLPTAIENLGRQAGLNFIFDPNVPGVSPGVDGKLVPAPLVTIRWENMTAEQALTALLKEHNLFLVESPVSSVSRISVTNHLAKCVDADWVRSGTNHVVPLIQMVDAPLGVALTHLVEKGKLNVEIDSKLSSPSFVPGKPIVPPPTVSFRWEKLTLRQAIAALCENYDLVMVKDAATAAIRISPKAQADAQPALRGKEKVKTPGN